MSVIYSIILLAACYGFLIEPNWVQVHDVWIKDSSLGKTLGRETVIQLSDLHINKIGQTEEKILRILEEVKPDIIFLTGDYVKWKGDYEGALIFLSRLKAKVGIWAILGDYDYSNSRKSCLFCHEPDSGRFTRRHRVHFLRNSSELINLSGGPIRVYGIDIDGEEIEETDSFPSGKRAQFPESKETTIVLAHNPLAFRMLSKDRNILMLAGDTHGGQVPLPSWIWDIMGYKKNALYSQGLFEEGSKKMFVSRGIGTSHVSFRLFRRPEVVILHFVP